MVPMLRTAIENEKSLPEDIFQAQVCLGWLYWLIGEETSSLSTLPTNLPRKVSPATEKDSSLSGWTYVCMIKSVCIRGQYASVSEFFRVLLC
jgi:hypothetical protein